MICVNGTMCMLDIAGGVTAIDNNVVEAHTPVFCSGRHVISGDGLEGMDTNADAVQDCANDAGTLSGNVGNPGTTLYYPVKNLICVLHVLVLEGEI